MKKYNFLLILLLIFTVFFAFAQTKEDKNIQLANHYYQNQDYKKAIIFYESLSEQSRYIQVIHEQFFKALLFEKAYKTCKSYFKRVLKWFPNDPQYNIDYGVYLTKIGKEQQALDFYDDYLERIKLKSIFLNPTGQYFFKYKRYDYAEKTYLLGIIIDPVTFGLELAGLYKRLAYDKKAIITYLNILDIAQNELETIEVELNDYINTEWENVLEKSIFQYISKQHHIVFNQLLVWLYTQKKDFYKAFLQAKSIDKRKKLSGNNLLELAKLTLNNKDYDITIDILNYLIMKYPHVTKIYYLARKELVRTQELQIKNTFPINKEKVIAIADAYKIIIAQKAKQNGSSNAQIALFNTFEETIDLAKLYAFYLDKKDTAILLLQQLLDIRFKHLKRPLALMTLGDVYVLSGKPWEATLVYLKVQEEYKSSEEANLAKLKNAKVHYYTGNFKLAKGYLDILKTATNRKTANDAIALSIFIDDNSGLDTTDIRLKRFTEIELLAYQNQYKKALTAFDQLFEDCSNHPLGDDILWQQSLMLRKLSRFEEAINKLQILLDKYRSDVLADEANYTIGLIYEINLKDYEKAKIYYKQQLLDFKGSWQIEEARERYRNLEANQ